MVLAATLLAASVVACAPPGANVLPVDPRAVVELDDAAVAARTNGGRVEVVALPVNADEPRVLTSSPVGAPNSGHLISWGGDIDSRWGTFFYGTAAPGVERVIVDIPGTTGGRVVDGAWLVAIPLEDLAPPDVRWTMLNASGTVVLEGVGIFPPDA